MANYNPEDAAKLKHLASVASAASTAVNAVDTKYANAFTSLETSGNTVNLKNTAGNVVGTIDFPEELYLQQTGTEIVENFTFSQATYPGATDPNLNGKTVLVFAVKGDKATNPTVKYSFVDMAKVIKAITAGDKTIDVNGYTIKVNISAETGNLLELKSDGLFVGSDDTKVDKATTAVQGNIAIFGASGAIVDSNVKFASDADVAAMLNEYFPTVNGGNG